MPVAARRGAGLGAAAAREKASASVGLYKPRAPIYPKLAHGTWRTIKWIVLVVDPRRSTTSRRGCAGTAARGAPAAGGAGRLRRPAFLLLLHRDLAAGGLLPHRPADPCGASRCSSSPRCSGGCGAAIPARRRSGPTSSSRVERLFEGDRNARMRLDAAPWSLRQGSGARVGKHAIWLADRRGHRRRLGLLFRRRADALAASSGPATAPIAAYVFIGHLHLHHLRRWPGSCASRSAPTCAPGRASRARCSTSTRCRSPIAPTAASRAARTRRARAGTARGDCIDCNAVRRRLPDRHRHPRRRPARMHQLRPLHRRLRRDHGPGRPARAA